MALPAPTTLVIGNHPFPHGNASANRMLGLAATFREAGEPAVVIADHPDLTEESTSELREASGVPYFVLGAPAATRAERRQRRATFPRRAMDAAWGGLDTSQVERIVMPSMMFTPATVSYLRFLMPGTALISDIVERHDPSQFRTRSAHPYFLRNRFTNWYSAKAADGAIVISTALAEEVSSRRRPPRQRATRYEVLTIEDVVSRVR